MAEDSRSPDQSSWLEAAGIPHILRTLGLAVHPAKVGMALAALILTFALGGVLDLLFKADGGVSESAVSHFVANQTLHQPYEEPSGELGIFRVWRDHQKQCIRGLLGGSLLKSSAGTTPGGGFIEPRSQLYPGRHLAGMGYGVWWMVSEHFFYFVLFSIGTLFIWSWGGGAICRMAALQFANDEKITLGQANRYARAHLIGGFALAPCIPVIGAIVISILLVIGGLVMRIPVLGDFLAGTAFFLALLAGFIVAILLIGLLVGGHLFWPAVAVEGQDAYDAFSRGLSYAFSKPWKTLLYAIITTVFAGICWIIVNFFTYAALAVTRCVVSFGTSPFGWWNRGSNDDPVSKMELLWPSAGLDALHAWPQWGELAWYEHYSGFVIGLFVLLVIGLMWAFLASFYFSGSTVIYFLLRRDVDKTDLEDVFTEEEKEIESAGLPESAPTDAGDASVPVLGESLAVPQSSPPPPPSESPPDDSDNNSSLGG
ncbi:MAG: hypothetical protein JSU63_03220 [Phycisphaerales bacterium]|nr:MAG: hypothetical protein JSU63_03220 [Phycisphaerales bacterium]